MKVGFYIMLTFNSLQEGLRFAFDGYEFHVVSLPNAQEPYFVGPELVPIFNVQDSSYITRYLSSFEYTNVNVKELPPLSGGSYGVHKFSPTVSLISLGGVFALCNRLYNRNPNVTKFADYINHVVLPTLWNNPQLVQRINDLDTQLKSSIWKTNAYRSECIDLRKENRSLNNQVDNLNGQVSELNEYKINNQPFNDLGKAVIRDESSVTINQFCKILSHYLNMSCGAHNIRTLLRDRGLLMKDQDNKNVPTQYSKDNGWMTYSYDEATNSYHTYITPKGIDYLLYLFKHVVFQI